MCLDGPQGVHAVDLKSWRECLRQRSSSAGSTAAPCVLGVSVKGSRGSPYQGAENGSENVGGTITESESEIKMEPFSMGF